MVRCFVQELGADVNEQSEEGFTHFYILAQPRWIALRGR
jgi:hypothetical protein